MPFVAQELVDAPQRLASLPDGQVMKEAVDKNEVKPFAKQEVRSGTVGYYEAPFVAISSPLDVRPVDVDPRIRARDELVSVCSGPARQIEHAARVGRTFHLA